MKQVDIIDKNIIYPIYMEDSINKELIDQIEYDLNEVVNKQLNKLTTIYTLGKLEFDKILFIGLGKKSETNSKKLREAFRIVSKHIKEESIFIALDQQMAELFVETYLHTRYVPQVIGHEKKHYPNVDIYSKEDVRESIYKGISIGESINYARELSDRPTNYMNGNDLVNAAKEMSSKYEKITCRIIDKQELEEMGAGGILAVNQGSKIPAYMIVLNYHNSDDQYKAVIGKGITFDTGGYTMKPNSYGMKYDMCGGANTIAIIEALAKLDIKTNVYGIVPTTDNAVSENAYMPEDVITTLSGKTVEVVSTDAEGRLILCDALTYAQQLGVTHMIDMATLTGACCRALGTVYTGIFTNSDIFFDEFYESLEESDEKGWRLPLDEEYFKMLKSETADFKNSAGSPFGAASVAGNFLNAFVDESVAWIHLDIAATANNLNKTATGAMIRSIINYLSK